MNIGHERRNECRVSPPQPIYAEYPDQQFRVRNISRSGAFLESPGRLAPGRTFQLKVCLSDGEPITVTAMVRRVEEGYGMGIEFLRMSESDNIRLRHAMGLAPQKEVSWAGSARGFSLPELMVVLSVIMLLAVLAIPRTRRAKEAAQEAAAAQSMRSIQSSQEAYRITHGGYASSFASLTDEGGGPLLQGEGNIGSSGGGNGDVLYYKGYLFNLDTISDEEYTLTAEPVVNRDTRPRFAMDHQLGSLSISGGAGTPPGDQGSSGGKGKGKGKDKGKGQGQGKGKGNS
jgi:prepilin-type N-terminal cleavage/methylation domain-containing protein